MKRQIILDTETTGLNWSDGHRIIEVGCLEMVNRRFTGKSFHYYLNPERAVDKEAFAVHGITDDFLKDKPFFKDIAAELLTFLSGAELIIHNATFDVGFLNYEFKRIEKNFQPLESACNILGFILARQKHPGQSNNLDALCRRYEVDITHRELHGALKDARLLGQVYLAMTGGQEVLFADNAVELTQEIRMTENLKPTDSKIPFLIVDPSD